MGIRGQASGRDTTVSERATIVVGADGRSSGGARMLGAPEYEAVEPLTCWYFSYGAACPPKHWKCMSGIGG